MFHIASDEDIKSGRTTDVYFLRTRQVMEHEHVDPEVTAEIRVEALPAQWEWGILAGIEEVAHLLRDVDVHVEALAEGAVFLPGEPVLAVRGRYSAFGIYETALLGLLCQASGVATKAARCRKAAGNKTMLSFGARRMHPALSPMIDRSAFIGGCDGVSAVRSAELIGEQPMGTIPHALILLMGDTVKAAHAFDRVMDAEVKRVMLVDTLGDEKFEALNVAEALGDRLCAVRLDTPWTRRGDFKALLEEVRWELDLRGYQHVQLFVSGGLDEYEIARLTPVADGYGVGTSLSNAPVIDFAMDIVEIEGRPMAKRGKRSGRKDLLRCEACGARSVVPASGSRRECPCGGRMASLLEPLMRSGTVARMLPSAQEIRARVLESLRSLEINV